MDQATAAIDSIGHSRVTSWLNRNGFSKPHDLLKMLINYDATDPPTISPDLFLTARQWALCQDTNPLPLSPLVALCPCTPLLRQGPPHKAHFCTRRNHPVSTHTHDAAVMHAHNKDPAPPGFPCVCQRRFKSVRHRLQHIMSEMAPGHGIPPDELGVVVACAVVEWPGSRNTNDAVVEVLNYMSRNPPLILGPRNPRPKPWPGNHGFIMKLTHGQPHQPRDRRIPRFASRHGRDTAHTSRTPTTTPPPRIPLVPQRILHTHSGRTPTRFFRFPRLIHPYTSNARPQRRQ
jgi:hypothetical protein